MCYDISFKVQINELSDYFPDLVEDDQISIDFEAAVHILGHAFGNHPIIYSDINGDRQLHLRLMEWGCIPFFVKDEKEYAKQRANMLNAQSERILDDGRSYWHKIRNRRCLVPVSAFYEHREIKGWIKKVPYVISLKDQSTFFLPGLYSVVELPDRNTGEMIKRWTWTIVTRKANDVMRQIHNGGPHAGRMALMLPFELSKKWVQENLSEKEYREILDFEMPSDALNYHPVYTIRSPKPRADNKAKDEFFEWPNLPPLMAV